MNAPGGIARAGRRGVFEPVAAVGHMPFSDHRTMAEVDEAEDRNHSRRMFVAGQKRAIEYGFDPDSLRKALH